jgi:hypothetical protein
MNQNNKQHIRDEQDEQKAKQETKSNEFKYPPSDLDELGSLSGTSHELDVICKVFNQNILQLLKFLISKMPDEPQVQALKSVMEFALEEDQQLMLNKCKEKIWAAKDQIRAKNSEYFLERDYSNLIKEDHNKSMIVTIVNLVKTGWTTLYDSEREVLWKNNQLMLHATVLHEIWRRIKSAKTSSI